MARTGRRPGGTQTREGILDAARTLFGEKGYDGTTIRAIARGAEVDPALVHHFFGSKEQVFVAAMRLPLQPGDAIAHILSDPDPRTDRAETLLRFFLEIWDDPQSRAPVLALVRSAMTNEDAADMMRGFISRAVLDRVAEYGIDPAQAPLIAAQLFGLALLRYVLKVEPLASADAEEVVRRYTPAIRSILEGREY